MVPRSSSHSCLARSSSPHRFTGIYAAVIAKATTPRVLDKCPTCTGKTITSLAFLLAFGTDIAHASVTAKPNITGQYPHNHNNNLRA